MLPLIVAGILVLSGLGAVATSNEDLEIELKTVVFSQPLIKSKEEFVTIEINEANTYLLEQGKPMLPSYTQTFNFPFGTKIKSVTCTPTDIRTQTVSKEIKPTPKAVIAGQRISKETSINYGTDTYPSNWYFYDVSSGLYDGVRSIIVEVQVNPIKYHPVEKTIEIAKKVDIEIKYEENTPSNPNPSNADYELIVIGPSEYSDEIAPLITHKQSRGITAKFASLPEVYGSPGRDNQEKIKYYIKDAIETTSTSNILLVGSSSKLPVRTTNIVSVDPPDAEIFVSDLYYADIYDGDGAFCSWDANSNNKFGEYTDTTNTDEVDLNPDIYLGRWACTGGSQVTTCVNKVKTYENTQAYKQAWFNNLPVCGGDTSPDYDVVEGELVNQKVIDMMTGFIPEKLWVTNGALTGWVPTGVARIKNAINSGCGFIDFSGHGNTNIWATHPEEDGGTWVPTPAGGIRSADIATLSNGDKLPIVAVEACSTAKFNADSNCFNWAFMQKSGGGAIGAFGATALGWGYVGNGIIQGLIGKMGLDTFRAYAISGALTLGEMWAKALDRYIDPTMDALDFKTTEEWIMFGDPTLAIAEESDPPAKPSKPNGPPNGQTGYEYIYTSSTTDPDGDEISYMFDWDDGTTSGWVGPYNSGQTASAKKTWTSQGTYQVRVVARDEHGKLSPWSDPLTVTMPRSKVIYNPFLNFLQNHPNMFPILRQLLGL